ncbi:MAG: hypothetical protein J6Y20_10045 [Lachnospiraceae bacterium]|nr:hypothetical protein [Lachnospiraceae bacterium]MBP5462454.1 hypothetical protein [Lachnospiraceae bacterium]
MKDWFKARNIWGAAIQTLSDEEAGRLMKAIWGYTMSGELHELTGAEKGIFALVLMTLNMDEEADNDISKKRALAGAKGGKQKVANQANAIFATEDCVIEANATNKNKNKERDIERNIPSVYQERKRFMPPTLEEVAAYCRERNNNVDPEKFIDFYSSKGWKVGNQPMKDWKACVRTWEKTYRETSNSVKVLHAQNFEQRDYSGVNDDLMTSLAGEMAEFQKEASP